MQIVLIPDSFCYLTLHWYRLRSNFLFLIVFSLTCLNLLLHAAFDLRVLDKNPQSVPRPSASGCGQSWPERCRSYSQVHAVSRASTLWPCVLLTQHERLRSVLQGILCHLLLLCLSTFPEQCHQLLPRGSWLCAFEDVVASRPPQPCPVPGS